MALTLTTYYSACLDLAGGLPTAGLRLHLRPEAGHGLATNTDGTLATWADQSGHPLVAVPNGGQPAPTPGAWAGGAGIYFSGQTALEPLDLGGAPTPVLTAILVLQKEAGASNIMPIHFGAAANQDLWLSNNYFGLNTFNGDINGIDQAEAALGQPVLVAAEVHSHRPGSFQLWLNGQRQLVGQQQGFAFDHGLDTTVRLGGSAGYYWHGWVGEVLIYDRALPDAAHRAIYEDLRQRYPALPPYAPAPPLLTTHEAPPTAADVPAGPLGWWRSATGLTHRPDGRVVRWTDLSGAGRDLPLTTAGLTLTSWAGSQAVYFDSQQRLAPLDLGGSPPQVLTAVLLLQKEAGASSIMPFHVGTGENQDLWFDSNHFGLNTFNSDIYGIDQAEAVLSQPVLVVAEFHSGQPGSFQLWLNGQAQALAQQQGTPSAHGLETIVRLGGYDRWRWHGWLAEALLYDRALAPAEQAQLAAYVRGRYQLPH